MKTYIKNYCDNVINNPLSVLVFVLSIVVIASMGISNFKLDASSDALVLEGDNSLKIYREAEEEFGDSNFLYVTYEPNGELFTKESLDTILSIEKDLTLIDGVDSVLSLMDAPIFFQPRVGLTDVADNLKDCFDNVC